MKQLEENGKQIYQCEECGLCYRDRTWAEQCEAWCKEYHTCNIDIISHAQPEEHPWWERAIIYEMYVDKFAGNFKKLINHLDYLSFLGINTVHLLPFYPSPMVDDGYDVSDFTNIRPELGTLQDFELFIKKARNQGIRVLIDLVLNHTSIEHPWFQEASQSRDNSKRDFYLWSKTGEELSSAINAFSHLKPNNWVPNPATGDYYFSTFYPEQADLNWDNPEVFNAVTEVMDFWVQRGVSAFRLDAVSHLIKREGTNCKGLPETHVIIKKIRRHINKNYPEIALLLETHDDIPTVKEYFGNGDESQLVYNFALAEKIILSLVRDQTTSVEELAHLLSPLPSHCRWAIFLRSHDELSLQTLSAKECDEIFTYADPEHWYEFRNGTGISMRLAGIFKKEPEKILRAFRALFSLPGVPIIYYGEEIGMENEAFDPTIKDTRVFVRSVFDWEKAKAQMKDKTSLLSNIAAMIQKRIVS